jgi:hypothetical protein
MAMAMQEGFREIERLQIEPQAALMLADQEFLEQMALLAEFADFRAETKTIELIAQGEEA